MSKAVAVEDRKNVAHTIVDVYDKDNDPVQAVAVIEIENGPEATSTVNDVPVVPVGFHSFWESVVRVEGPATTIVLAEDYAKSMGVFSPLAGAAAWIDNLYRITDRGSSFWNEFVGGMTTFFSIAYIMVINPKIIGGSYPRGSGLKEGAVFFVTTLSAGIFTFTMGALVNIPVALAPGMGLNTFFKTMTSSCQPNVNGNIDGVECPGWGEDSLPWSDALGAIFLSGVFYLFLTVTGMRTMLLMAIPSSVRAAITAGIGFFLTAVGLHNGSLIRINLNNLALGQFVYPAGNCQQLPAFLGGGQICDNSVDIDYKLYSVGFARFNYIPEARIAVVAVVFVTMFEIMKFRGAIIISIILATFVGINYYNCGKSVDMGNTCVTDLTSFSQEGGATYIIDTKNIPAGRLTFKYANKGKFWEAVFGFLFIELFESSCILNNIMERCGFLKDNHEIAMARVNRGMCVDGFGLILGAIIGANSITCFAESSTGIEAGVRTGVASMVTGAAFLLSLLFVQPFVGIIPDAATTGALLMVGVHSVVALKGVDFEDFTERVTAFFVITTMALTFSIANGIAVAFIFYTWMRTVQFIHGHIMKKLYPDGSEKIIDLPHPILFVGALFSVLRYAMELNSYKVAVSGAPRD